MGKVRTVAQNKALHVFFSLLAKELNGAGLDMRTVLKPGVEIPWSPILVKDHLWKPLQKAVLKKESTTQLNKQMEIDKVHEVLMRHLGEKFGLEYVEFPFDKEKISNYATVDNSLGDNTP